MKTRTATLVLEGGISLSISYDWYIECDGEYTVVVLEKPNGDQEYDYELICRQPINSEMEAETVVDRWLRQAIQTLASGYIGIRS